jgi:holo-[acyl-carrier protein] synthase
MKLATGVDLVEIQRLEEVVERHGPRFLDRVYTSRERDQVGDDMASLAARFAAKEAVSKALGCGIGAVGWHDIEILRGSEREPTLTLHGAALKLADDSGFLQWSLSLSHTRLHAIAMVVALGDVP